MLDRLTRNGQVVMQYVDRFGRPTQEFPANPNGSTDAIAGICDETGRVFGLMPHPEAFNHITNHPHYHPNARGVGSQEAAAEGRR